MNSDTPQCWSCSTAITIPVGGKIAFREECPKCGKDLHCCYSCTHYDESAYNSCKEPQADRVIDKERANFCEYHLYKGTSLKSTNKEDAYKKLDDLFK